MQSGRPDGDSYLIGMPDPIRTPNPYDKFKEEMARSTDPTYEPTPFMPPENVRQPEPMPYPFPKKPAYEPNPYDQFKEEMSRSTEPAYDPTPFMPPVYTPQTSYRQMPDGSLVEIGYDGGPLSEYGLEKLGIHNETIGKTKPDYRYEYDERLGRVVRVPVMADKKADENRSGLMQDQQRLMNIVQMLKGK
jgi:hypothetical protein